MPTRDEAPIGAPCWIDLFTTDPDASRRFYEALFGWESEESGPEFGHYIMFTKDGVPIAGGMRNDGADGTPDMWSIYLAVEDAEKTTETATSNGGGVIVPPMVIPEAGTMAVLTDAGGAGIGIWQPNQHKGFGILGEPGTPNWFELHTRAYDASVAWYRDVFGWDTHTASDEPDLRYTTLGEGDDQLAGIMDATAFLPEGVPANWTVYFGTEDTDATIAQVHELGGSTIQPAEDTPYGRLAAVADCTGAIFRLITPPAA